MHACWLLAGHGSIVVCICHSPWSGTSTGQNDKIWGLKLYTGQEVSTGSCEMDLSVEMDAL
jgi:hypothetical protein